MHLTLGLHTHALSLWFATQLATAIVTCRGERGQDLRARVMVVTHCKNWFTDRVLQARDRAIARYRGAPRGSLAGGGAPLSPALSPTLSPRIAPAESPTGDARAPSPLEVCGAVSAFSRPCVPVDRLHPASPLKTAPAPVGVALCMLVG